MELRLEKGKTSHGGDLMLQQSVAGARIFMPLLLLGSTGILVLGPTIRLSRVQGQLREPRAGAFQGLYLAPVWPGVRDREGWEPRRW